MTDTLTTTLPTNGPYDLEATLWLMSMGKGNPCLQMEGPQAARIAVNTPAGPTAMHVRHEGDQLHIEATGEGAKWMQPHLVSYLGVDFEPPRIAGLRKLRQLAYDWRGLRLVRMPTVYTSLVQIVLQQLISYRDACYGWRKLVQRYGTPVPGQDDLHYPPLPSVLAKLHSHHFIECGVLPMHGKRIVEVSRAVERIEAAWNTSNADDALQRTSQLLLDLPGIGPWTVGLLRGAALGDVDAEVRDDYSMPKFVRYFFEGPEFLASGAEATDEDMLELLEPYRPHRFYVLTLINKGGDHPPRRGPRRKSVRERF